MHLQIAQRTAGNLVLRDALVRIEHAVTAGADIGEALADTRAFPPMVVQMFALGQQSGRLEEMLDRLAQTYDQQLNTSTQRLAAILEPLLIIILALIVLFIVLATVLPILEAGNVAEKGTRHEARRQKDHSCLRASCSVPSLVEIMIVVVIIGLLAAMVTYATTAYLDRAKRQRAKADIATYSGAVDSFYLEKGRFPDNSEGLRVLAPSFVKVLQNDPWGRPYQYRSAGQEGASTTSSATAPMAARAGPAPMRTSPTRTSSPPRKVHETHARLSLSSRS